jgi:hypothetical protein
VEELPGTALHGDVRVGVVVEQGGYAQGEALVVCAAVHVAPFDAGEEEGSALLVVEVIDVFSFAPLAQDVWKEGRRSDEDQGNEQ